MYYLGIDHAPSNYAICIIDDDNNIIRQENFKFKGTDFDAEKLLEIKAKLHSLDLSSVAFACLEGYAINERFYREIMGEIGAINRIFLLEKKTPFAIISPIQLKYYHTGSGKSAKEILRDAIKETLPDIGKDLNISDAGALALYARDIFKLTHMSLFPDSKDKQKLIKELCLPKESDKPKKKRLLYLDDTVLDSFKWATRSSIIKHN